MTDLIKQVKQKLTDDLIISFNEPIISLIQVQNPKKRKEEYINKFNFLLATINNDNNSTPIVHLLKVVRSEKLEIKLKSTWRVNQIKLIKLQTEDPKQTKFEFTFDFDKSAKFEWKCETNENCVEFLTAIWKLSEQFLTDSNRPKFVNFQRPEHVGKHMNAVAAHLFPLMAHDRVLESNGHDIDEIIPDIDINRKDEDALLKLFAECDYATSNVDRFVDKLQAELVNLETSNVEGIMNSEENTIKLIAMLDKAVDEIEKIDQRLQIYEDKISAVGDAVKKVGNEDNFIQIQENNQKNLLSVLENMIRQLDLSEEHERTLRECDLTSRLKIDKCVQAANALLKALDSRIPDGLADMNAYKEQRKSLIDLQTRFSATASHYVKNAISFVFNKHSDSYKIIDNSLNILPSHKSIFDDLIIFKDLIPWLYKSYNQSTQNLAKGSKQNYYEEVKTAYIDAAKNTYAKEVIPFCVCARSTILKQEKPRTSAVASMENLKNQLQKTLDKGYSGDIFSLKIDQQTKDILKSCFRKLLKQLSETVQLEENFCHEFFNVKTSIVENGASKQGNSSITSPTAVSTPSKMSDQTKNDLQILRDIFNNLIEEQVKVIIESIQKLEPMTIIFIYSELLYHVLVSYNNKHYMHQPLVWLLRVSKEKCDEYTNDLKEAIKDYKLNKRERIGIIKYIIYFEEFVRESEICWEPIKKDMYEKLCIIYQIVVNEIFHGIETIAQDSQKTPPDVVRFQNYHQMNHIMRSISGLKESTKYAKDQFNLCKQSYIKEHFGRPLEKLSFFFEKVEQRAERGVKYEDISYQMDLSVNNLREIIREYPGKEVKKGLESLYRKVEKHLGENNGLLQVIWRDMTEEFIRQYQNYEKLISLCYPGQKINLEFTAAEVTQYFAEIAQSH